MLVEDTNVLSAIAIINKALRDTFSWFSNNDLMTNASKFIKTFMGAKVIL